MTRSYLSVLPWFDRQLRDAQRILIASDFDGTLCPIADSPSDVRVAPATMSVLRSLSASENIRIAVISGRALDDVRKRLPIKAVFAGNHGLQICGDGISFEHETASQLRPELQQICADLKNIVSQWSGAWVEEKGLSATVHYRGVEPEEQHAIRCAVRQCVVGRSPSIGLRPAKMALELYPKIGWGKGEALRHIRNESGPFDLCICMGDDLTDEDMFIEDSTQINIKVGLNRPTKAQLHLSDSHDVTNFLAHVLSITTESDPLTSLAIAG